MTNRLLLPVGGLALVCSGFGAGIAVSATAADEPAPVVVTREPLAEVTAPPGAPHRTLGLSKVVVMPGAKLASHHHPGAQLGYVAEGTLTYTVESGQARLMKGPGDDPTLVRTIEPGETAKVRPGRWLVEEQDAVHHARNAGTTPIVIYIATLLRTGEPAAISD
ncbi:cupin domain-containing protein [Nocardioides sp.]|uniref:cupin domain-containing protein n=1 Tax=Nocardioides sp. TaxID=35761 RepID=UPI0025EBD8EE|nr:cupin domain-containing protein [Nocardioides sp.]